MILLTHAYFLTEDEKEQRIMKPYVPLGILYIASYLDSKGISNTVYDSTFSSFDALKNYLLANKPGLVGVYTNLMTKVQVLKLIQFIKTNPLLSNTKIILGGPEIRYNAANYLKHGADMLVVGEGEETFYELVKTFLEEKKLAENIKGTAFLKNGEVFFNEERALLRNIDELPAPARHKIDLSLYGKAWKQAHGYSMYSVSTMRGCPYTCKWCSRAVYGGTYRRRSPALVVQELEHISQNYAPDMIWFVDDVFTISHKWLREFRDELNKKNLRIPYEIITRADRMTDEVIAILKETGCFRVWIGAESGSQKIIDAMDRRVDVQAVRDNIIKARKAGIEAGTFIMLGYPGEKKEDIRETIRHLQLSQPDQYTVTLAYPINGTPLYNEVNSSIVAEKNWEESTDRDYDFKRSHSRRFYHHAIKWVYAEVLFSRTKDPVKKIKLKARSFLAQIQMLFA